MVFGGAFKLSDSASRSTESAAILASSASEIFCRVALISSSLFGSSRVPCSSRLEAICRGV